MINTWGHIYLLAHLPSQFSALQREPGRAWEERICLHFFFFCPVIVCTGLSTQEVVKKCQVNE